MFEKFSEAARRSIFLARSEANRLGFDEIDTPHLLLGVLLENAGERDSIRHPSSIREEISEDRICIPREHSATAQWSFLTPNNADQLRTRFTILGPRSAAPLPENADMPLSSRAKKVLATAFDHAGDHWVTTLDLLWAMLSDDQQEVAESINAVGINREQIDEEIRRSRGRHKPGFE